MQTVLYRLHIQPSELAVDIMLQPTAQAATNKENMKEVEQLPFVTILYS